MGLLVKYIQESGFFLLEDLEVVDLPDWVRTVLKVKA